MFASQLKAACHCQDFIGVYSIDQLPTDSIGKKFIVNTQTHNLPGEHWIAVNGNDVFDPYGIYYPSVLCKYLFQRNNGGRRIKFSTAMYQAPWTQLCGEYCIYWLHYGTYRLVAFDFKHNKNIIMHAKYNCQL